MHRFVIAKYTLIEALKRRLIYLYFLGIIICASMASYGASLAFADKQAVLAALYGFLSRLFVVGITGSYIILTEMKNLDRDYAFVWMGLPISRLRYLLEKMLAYVVLLLISVLILLLPLCLMGTKLSTIILWGGSLICELSMLGSLAMLLAILFRQALTSLSLFAAIYLFARSSAEFLRHSNNILIDQSSTYETVLAILVKMTTYLVPKLEQFAPSNWLLHSESSTLAWGSILWQTLLFSGLLLLIAFEQIRRRTF